MSRIQWGKEGERTFEAGVDRGVLYVEGSPGVAWNGLVSLEEVSTKGSIEDYYMDGVKYYTEVTQEEFGFNLEAFTYPEEFAACDGTLEFGRGMYMTQQERVPFHISYRSLIGNDIQGTDLGYKLHFVYNCLAVPQQLTRDSLSDAPDPTNLSWAVVTTPFVIENKNGMFVPVSHLYLDSREVNKSTLRKIEEILYGSTGCEPRMPSPEELLDALIPTWEKKDVP